MSNRVPGSRSKFVFSTIKMFLGGSLIVVKGRGITLGLEIGVSEVIMEEEEVEMFKGGEAYNLVLSAESESLMNKSE